MRRITVVTGGHLSTCPRMLKAADALHEAGYDVRVISTINTPWATAADRALRARRRWRWDAIDYSRRSAPIPWFATGLRWRIAKELARRSNGHRSRRLAAAAFSRVHAELVRVILREPADLIYGGTGGALAAVTEAARASGTPCAVDFEDFHCGEHARDRDGGLRDALASEIMADAIRTAAFVTAGSAAIARACEERFGPRPVTINNVFALPAAPAAGDVDGSLRLYWFSQTIGPRRGLEDVVRAAGRARIACRLHLRGIPVRRFVDELRQLATQQAPTLQLLMHAPEDADAMVDTCRGFDIGLAAEPGDTPNSALSLSNKALTYPLAGLALVLTDTPGQRPLADDLHGEAILYAPGRIEALAEGLARWASNPAALRRAKAAAWDAARRRWHWEHEHERGALLGCVAGVFA